MNRSAETAKRSVEISIGDRADPLGLHTAGSRRVSSMMSPSSPAFAIPPPSGSRPTRSSGSSPSMRA